MRWKDIPLPEKERLAQQYIARIALDEEARLLGMKCGSLERKIRDYLYYKRELLGSVAANVQLDESPSRTFLDYETLHGDDFIVIGDIEIPDHDVQYLLAVLFTAMNNNIRKLVIAGDLVATDMDALNHWVSTWKTGDEANYEQAINATRKMLIEYGKWFDEIVIIEGNHDDRISRKTGGQVHLGMFLVGTNVTYSRYAHLWLETKRGPVKVVHPSNFSGDPITLAQKLYSVEPRKAHYVVAHCHRRQDGWSADGAFEMHAIGTGRDPARTKYKATSVNKHKQWDQSFLMIKHGWHFPLDLKSTNWPEVMGDLHEQYRSRVLATTGDV